MSAREIHEQAENSTGKQHLLTLPSKIWTFLKEKQRSEEELRELALSLEKNSQVSPILIRSLLEQIPVSGSCYDWNVGSIVQHWNAVHIIDAIAGVADNRIFDSSGLAWVLGEYGNTHHAIVAFLYTVVNSSSNSEAWWRAAFSLEKLGVESAVSLLKLSLKSAPQKQLDYYIDNLKDKRSVIGILISSNVETIERIIYPALKITLTHSRDASVLINCCWLIGRLRLIDQEIAERLALMLSDKDFEIRYYTFFAIQNNATETLRNTLESSLSDSNVLIRRMSARGLASIGNEQSLQRLTQALWREDNSSAVAEQSKAIYQLKNPFKRAKFILQNKSFRNENGMISDESDKWYWDPATYQTFSEAEDPDNLCFSLVKQRCVNHRVVNPIDLATGTGRMVRQIIEKIRFEGSLLAVDANKNMCDFLAKAVRRERIFTHNIKIVCATIEECHAQANVRSSFIVSSFGFPSRITHHALCVRELAAVYELLTDDGIFFTIGWDESFNDELNHLWYRFIPDRIVARNFEEWRQKRASSIRSPRNCGLTWLKRGIRVPLQFSSAGEAASVMGYLFGRDAAQYVIEEGRYEWSMSLGVTCNTRDEIGRILAYERDRNSDGSAKL